MVWIECTETNQAGRPSTQAITVDGERVEFTDNGKANVSKDVAETLVSLSDEFAYAGSEPADDAGADESAEDDSDDSDDE